MRPHRSPNSPSPESRATLVARATRAKTLPLVIVPVLLGTALAGTVDWVLFALTVAGAAFAHLSAMVLNDVFDQQCDRIAGMDRTAIVTASGLIQTGKMSARAMSGLGVGLGAGAVACAALIALERPGALIFAAAGAFLAVFYSGPPIRYGYLGRGLGELGQVLAYGVLPVAGAAYVHTGVVEHATLWLGLIPGALTTLVFFHHNLLHHKADRAVGKRTPAALLGAEAALLVSAALIGASYAGLAIEVAVGLLPAAALVGIVPVVQLYAAWARAFRDPAPQPVLHLLGATLGASALTGIWLIVSVWIW